MGPNTHQGSKNNLLGKDPSPELVELLSNEKQVTKATPPCFIWHTWEDPAVPVENSLQLLAALRAAKVPAEAHFFEEGGHGFGIRYAVGKPAAQWPDIALAWLRRKGFAK